MSFLLANPQVEVNGLSVAIVPNSLSFTGGGGEQTVKSQSSGGASVEQVFSDNAESKFSMVKFDLYSTDENISNARIWKFNLDNNTISVTGGPNSDTHRIFNEGALTNDYEVNLKNEGIFSLEFHTKPAA